MNIFDVKMYNKIHESITNIFVMCNTKNEAMKLALSEVHIKTKLLGWEVEECSLQDKV